MVRRASEFSSSVMVFPLLRRVFLPVIASFRLIN
jgi:hypothetical protein